MKTLLSSLAIVTFLATPVPATACGVLSEVSKYDRQKQLENMRAVKGVFRVIERLEYTYTDYDGEQYVQETIFGRIETARGTGWNTVHINHPNMIVCASFFQPAYDAEGTFFINRHLAREDDFGEIAAREGKFYQMRHYDGEYLEMPRPDDLEQTR